LTIARDEHNWRDVGGPSNLHVEMLTPAQRRAAERAAERQAQKMAEDYARSVKARREADAAVESSMDAVVAKASEIKTPAQERAEKLGWVLQPDGSLVHKAEFERRAAQREAEYDGGATPEERAELEAWLEEDDDDEEDPWR
jgi:hypothetical protein